MQFVGNPPGQLPRQRGTLLERNARDGHQRQHVRGTHAGMGSLMMPHVDPLGRGLHPGKGRLDDRLGFSDEGYDRTVRRLARIDIEHLHASGRLDRRNDLPDHLLVASLAEIGDALHDSFFHLV